MGCRPSGFSARRNQASTTSSSTTAGPRTSRQISRNDKCQAMNANAKVRDPVCGMMIDPAHAAGQFNYQGKTYYFCNPGCLKKFQANPAAYLEPKPAASPLVTIGGMAPASRSASDDSRPSPPASHPSTYTCPMHPGDCARRTGKLPDLRHGAGATNDHRRGATKSRIGRDVAPLLDQPRAERATVGHRDARHASRHARSTLAGALPRCSGFSSLWPPPSCCGAAGRFSSAAGNRS